MADLGNTADLVRSALVWALPDNAYSLDRSLHPTQASAEVSLSSFELPRNAYNLDRAANPIRAEVICQDVRPAAWEGDFQSLGGTLSLLGGSPVARKIRAIHRPTGVVIACAVSRAVDGAFLIRVPPCADGVDLHILAEPGDGCDAYLPRRTPVDG